VRIESEKRQFCCRRVVALWVIERLPEDRITTSRSSGTLKVYILRKVEIWSTPALVRESDANTMPASSIRATQ
jgi:hypothetical protein